MPSGLRIPRTVCAQSSPTTGRAWADIHASRAQPTKSLSITNNAPKAQSSKIELTNRSESDEPATASTTIEGKSRKVVLYAAEWVGTQILAAVLSVLECHDGRRTVRSGRPIELTIPSARTVE